MAAKSSSVRRLLRASTIRKPNPDCVPAISPATRKIHAVPKAMCSALAMTGNTAGSTILNRVCALPRPKFFDTFKYTGSMRRTAPTVESSTGKNAARKITTMAGMSPMPSHNTMNGSHATGEMGRRNCTTGFRKSHARVHQPMTRPNSTADTQAIR